MPRRHRRAKTDRIDGETLIRALMAWKRGEPRACSMVKLLTPEEDDNRRIGRERKTLIAERVFHVNRIKGLLFTQGIRDYEPVNRDRRQRLDEVRTGDGCPLSKHLKAEICRELDRLELLLTKAELARIFGLGKRRRWPWNGFRAELARQELLPDGTRPCVPIPRRKWRAHTGRTSALQFRGPFPTCVNDGYDHNCEIGRNSVRAMQ
jgi:hypothetical protein